MNDKSTFCEGRGDVTIHGWDCNEGSWHGPTPLTRGVRGARTTAARIKNAQGAFHGRLRCSLPGLPCIEFQTSVYDLLDVGFAIVHLDGAYDTPAGIVAVIPATRRSRLRPEFAFEFVTVLSFLGVSAGNDSELAIHDYIEAVLRAPVSGTEVFTAEAADLNPDASIVLSAHFEHLAAAMVVWLAMKDLEEEEEEELPARAATNAASQAFAAA